MTKDIKVRINLILVFAFMVALTGSLWADRGSFVLQSARENISVYDEGQKAVICWNDGEEILILSTDKYASEKAKVLEFLPLPSKPSRVEKFEEPIFDNVGNLIKKHRPRDSRTVLRGKNGGSRSHKSIGSDVEIVFHKKIGAHDITIAKINRMKGFNDWAAKFFKKHQVAFKEEDTEKLRPVVEDYLDRGFSYFVFDVIELTKEKKSIAPVLYQFKSPNLYFPLKVTTLSEGITTVSLYLFTPFKTDIYGTRTGFVSGFYAFGNRPSYKHPVKFKVTEEEMETVSKEVKKFMKGGSDVWFSTARFKGKTKELIEDFILMPR